MLAIVLYLNGSLNKDVTRIMKSTIYTSILHMVAPPGGKTYQSVEDLPETTARLTERSVVVRLLRDFGEHLQVFDTVVFLAETETTWGVISAVT